MRRPRFARSPRSRAWLQAATLAATFAFAGCTCGAKPTSTGAETSPPPAAPMATALSAQVGASSGGAIYSAPIAAARTSSGAILVVGLVVRTKTITASRIEADGHTVWARELLSDVAWSADAELKAYPVAGGAIIVWRGLRAGKTVKQLVGVAEDSQVFDGPIDIGAPACTTDDGAAWVEPAGSGKLRVRLRTWGSGDGAAHDELGPVSDDDLTILCGAHHAYAISDASDESPMRVDAVPQGTSTQLTYGVELFGHDEERDLLPYADGDDLGVVRISAEGSVQVADMQQGKSLLLRRERNKVPVDDDVVAVDADAHSVYVVYTHDESDSCKGDRTGASVHALRIARQGESDARVIVAPAECGKDAGPFWTGSAGTNFVIAWAERAPRSAKGAAPIASLAYRVMDGKSPVRRIPQPADALVDAGCFGSRCYAVALAREPGADGMQPEAARVLAYP